MAATGDDPERWTQHAPPGYAAAGLLTVAGQLLSTAALREKIKAIMDRREPFYERAHVVVEIRNQRVGITVDEVVKALRRYGKGR